MPSKVTRYNLLRPVPLLIIAGVLCFSGWFVFGTGGLWDSYQLRERYLRQQAEIADLQAKKEWLAKQLADLKANDELALEQAARNYGLVASEETIYEIKVEPAKP